MPPFPAIALLAYLLVIALHPLAAVDAAVVSLTSEEFKTKKDAGEFAVVVDVRSDSEWSSGHIADATHIAGLQDLDSIPSELKGCEACDIAVYCRSGARAGVAINKLVSLGFSGTISNGQGVNQWQAAGYTLVNTASREPICSQTATSGTCAWIKEDDGYSTTKAAVSENDSSSDSGARRRQAHPYLVAAPFGQLSSSDAFK